jgi:hypothetical protein
MDYPKVYSITSQSIYKGKYMTDVVIRGTNLLGNGKSVKRVTLAGISGNVILANKNDIFMYAGFGEPGLQGVICIENDLGEVVTGGSWKYE